MSMRKIKMKFKINNLGPIKEADINLGDLTIICGKNNCGKTYLTYALYSFLHEIKKNLIISDFGSAFDTCYKEGCYTLNIRDVKDKLRNTLSEAMPNFVKHIPELLAINPSQIENAQCFVHLDSEEFEIFVKTALERKYQVTEKCSFSFKKEKESEKINIVLENTGCRLPKKANLRQAFNFVCSLFINKIFPDVFSLTGERSGISILGDDIADFPRNMSTDTTVKLTKLRKKIVELAPDFGPKFPLPIMQELAFFQNIKAIRRRKSYIASDYPELLNFADNLSDGRYEFNDYTGIQYYPINSSQPLNLIETSSSVKSLVEFNFYLSHCAQKHQILMIDEPELNLHPENQRKMARMLAMLVNAGIKVFITTHSDYIIRELNTLIMLGKTSQEKLEQIKQQYDIREDQVLTSKRIEIYEAKHNKEIVPAEFDSEVGVTITDMDNSLVEISRMQRKLLYGE